MSAPTVRGVVAGGVALVCVIGLGVASARTTGAADPLPRTEASRFVPVDGWALPVQVRGGGHGAVEQAVGPLDRVAAALPGAQELLQQADPGLALPDGTDPTGSCRDADCAPLWWRETITQHEWPTVRVSLHAVTARGVELRWLDLGFGAGLALPPGLVVLPATVSGGTEWQSTGSAVATGWSRDRTGSASWQLRGQVLPDPVTGPDGRPDPDCRAVTIELSFRVPGPEGTNVSHAYDRRDTWCPGRGVVARATSSTSGAASYEPLRRQPGEATGVSTTDLLGLGWLRSAGRIGVRFESIAEGFGGPSLRTGVVPWVVGDDPVVLHPHGRELIGTRPVDDGPEVLTPWGLAHPGGRPTTVTSIGNGLLVTTSQGHLVAYGYSSVRAWTVKLTDLAAAAPVPYGDDEVAVLTVDGNLTGYDVAAGQARWRTRVGGQVVAGSPYGILAVVGRDGLVTVLSADGRELHRSRGRTGAVGIAVAGGRPIIWGRDWVAAPPSGGRPGWLWQGGEVGAVVAYEGMGSDQGDPWARVAIRVTGAAARLEVVNAADGRSVGQGDAVRAMVPLRGGLAVVDDRAVRGIDEGARTTVTLLLPRWDPGADDEVALRSGQTTLWAFSRNSSGEVRAAMLTRSWRG